MGYFQKEKKLVDGILLKNRKKTLLILLLSVIVLTLTHDLWMTLIRATSTRWEWPDLLLTLYQVFILLANLVFFLLGFWAVRKDSRIWSKGLFFAYFGYLWLAAFFDLPSCLTGFARIFGVVWSTYSIESIIDLLLGLTTVTMGVLWLSGLSGRIRSCEMPLYLLSAVRLGLYLCLAIVYALRYAMLFSSSESYPLFDLPWYDIIGAIAQLPITLIFYVGRGYVPAEGKTGGPERIVSAPDKGPEGGGGAAPQESRPAVQAAPVPGGYGPDEGGTPGGGEQKNE